MPCMSGILSRGRTKMLALLVSTALGILAVEWGLRWVYPYLPSISALQGSDFRLERLVDLAEDPDLSPVSRGSDLPLHRSRGSAGRGIRCALCRAEFR